MESVVCFQVCCRISVLPILKYMDCGNTVLNISATLTLMAVKSSKQKMCSYMKFIVQCYKAMEVCFDTDITSELWYGMTWYLVKYCRSHVKNVMVYWYCGKGFIKLSYLLIMNWYAWESNDLRLKYGGVGFLQFSQCNGRNEIYVWYVKWSFSELVEDVLWRERLQMCHLRVEW